MSSAVVSTPAALGRPFVFDDEAEVSSLGNTSRAALDRTAEGGYPHINLQGMPESHLACLQSAINNQKSKNSPARVTPALAAATRRGEFCALVDASDALDPHSAAAAGVELDHLLWVRCGEDAPQKSRTKPGCPISRASVAREACPEPVERVGISSQAGFDFDRTGLKKNGLNENSSRQSDDRLEQVLRATDLLLESGGFGLIVLDLADLPSHAARRIPLTTWFRFRRAIEHTPTILLTIEQHPIAGSCSSLLLKLGAGDPMLSADEPAAKRRENAAHGASRGFDGEDQQASEGRKKISAQPELDLPHPAHVHLLTGLDVTAELIRSRLDRKPARSVAFATKTAWAG